VIDRARKPRDLGIDFAALEKRKQREYDKLERMIKYAQSGQCRRSVILGYFGDTQAAATHCGRCDNCASPAGGEAGDAEPRGTIDTPGGCEVVLKVLSGVARAKGRFGKNVVAQMLCGSASEKMDRWGLKRLSTYGLLNTFRQSELVQILDAMERAGLIASQEVDRFRPIVNLTDEGWRRLRAQGPFDMALALPDDLRAKILNGGLERLPFRTGPAVGIEPPRAGGLNHTPVVAPLPASAPTFEDDALGERLRALRQEWAREASMPAYIIFPNQVLDELVRLRPRTPQALGAIKGLGPSRLERYGEALLAAIAEAPEASPAPASIPPPPPAPARVPSPPAPVITPANRSGAYVPTEEWTWRLLERGFTPNDAAAIRGLMIEDIVRHALLAVRQGRPLAPEAFLAPEVVRRWDAWRAEHGDETPPADAAGARLWRLFLACRDRSSGA
jgi:ATP-dependent DNA helicase RecQ